MLWYNLKNNKCPQCSNALEVSGDRKTFNCFKCKFYMSSVKFYSIRKSLEMNEIYGIEKEAKKAQKLEDAYWNDPDF